MLISQTVTTPATKSCPELWNRAVDRYHDACKERDGLKHHRKLMEAGEAFTQVVLAAGHYPEEKSFALNNLGLIMQAINRLPEAGNAFGFALTLNPDNATIMHNFATIRMCMDDFKGANEWFHKALEKDPKCPESRYNASY